MRFRKGDHLHEAHGEQRLWQFIADGSKSGGDIARLIGAAVPGLLSDGTSCGGAVHWSERPDGSLWVGITLYEADCSGECGLFHHPNAPKLKRLPDLTPAQQAAIKNAVGEHPQHKLTGTPADEAVLRAIGMGPDTHPHLHGGK